MMSLKFFIDIIPSALGSTQPLTEMVTRNISWGEGSKCGRSLVLQPYHLHVPTVRISDSLNFLEPSRPFQACTGIAVPFTHFVLCRMLHIIHNLWTVSVRSLAKPTINCTMIRKYHDGMLKFVQNQNSK
jgi:hypothetical protein